MRSAGGGLTPEYRSTGILSGWTVNSGCGKLAISVMNSGKKIYLHVTSGAVHQSDSDLQYIIPSQITCLECWGDTVGK